MARVAHLRPRSDAPADDPAKRRIDHESDNMFFTCVRDYLDELLVTVRRLQCLVPPGDDEAEAEALAAGANIAFVEAVNDLATIREYLDDARGRRRRRPAEPAPPSAASA